MASHALDYTGDYIRKWQKILNILAEVADIPAALIMKLVDDRIEVFVSSQGEANPYLVGGTEHFENSGLYCETTIKRNRELLVPNALEDPAWKDNPDARLGMVSYLGLPIHYPDQSAFGTICILDRKENAYSGLIEGLLESFRDAIETDLSLMESYRSLQTVLREAHHRMKNNIASIGSFLNLQASLTGNAEARSILEEAVGRVGYMGLVYDKLLIDNRCASLSAKAYIEELVPAILGLFQGEGSGVSFRADVEDLWLGPSLVADIGLVINELVTNSMKYAFAGGAEREIRVGLEKANGEYRLTVADNGAGLPDGFSLDGSRGFGFSIVDAIARQLGGRLELSSSGGTRASIAWKGER